MPMYLLQTSTQCEDDKSLKSTSDTSYYLLHHLYSLGIQELRTGARAIAFVCEVIGHKILCRGKERHCYAPALAGHNDLRAGGACLRSSLPPV